MPNQFFPETSISHILIKTGSGRESNFRPLVATTAALTLDKVKKKNRRIYSGSNLELVKFVVDKQEKLLKFKKNRN